MRDSDYRGWERIKINFLSLFLSLSRGHVYEAHRARYTVAFD